MKRLLFTVLLAVLLIAAVKVPLMRVVVENQSEYPAYYHLYPLSPDVSTEYWFTVKPLPDGEDPKVFTFLRGVYRVEERLCNNPEPAIYDLALTKSEVKILIPPCGKLPSSNGGDGLFVASDYLYESGNKEPYDFTGGFRY